MKIVKFSVGKVILLKSIALALALAISSNSYSSDKPQIPDEVKTSISLSIGNLICGMYGEFTSEMDAPLHFQKHLEMAKIMAHIAYSYDILKLKSKVSASGYYDGMREALITDYKNKGPSSLKSHLNDFMINNKYFKPNWVKSCDDVYSYSQSIRETSTVKMQGS